MIRAYRCGVFIAFLIVAAASHADIDTDSKSDANSNSALGEVIVTARRVQENLQNVPVSVTVISGETMRAKNVVSVAELQQVSPSLGVTTTTGGSGTPVYAIRGERSFGNSTLQDPAVTVYFAEVGQSIATGTNVSVYDLQSAQVLKGPQGTLFGRNTTGGAILLTPAAPSSEFEGYGQITGGDFDLKDFEGVVNVPVTDTLQIRMAGKITRRDGYMEDPVRGDKAGDEHSNSARVSIRWSPGSKFQTTTIATYFDDDVQNALKLDRVNTAGIPALPFGGTALLAAALTSTLAQISALGKYQFNDYSPQTSRDTVYGVQNISTYDLGSGWLDTASLKNIFGYRNVTSLYHTDLDGSPLGIIDTPPAFPAQLTAQELSNELQLIGSKGNLDFITGLFYYRTHADDYIPSFQLIPLATLLSPPFNAFFPAVSVQESEARNESYAGFVHLNYKLDELVRGLSVSGGGRFTEDGRGVILHNRTSSGLSPTAFTCTLTGVTGLPNNKDDCAVRADTSFGEPTWDGSINYQVTEDVLVYAADRRGYRSGGWNVSPPTIASIPSSVFQPEIIDDYELGLKSNFNVDGVPGRFNLAVFHDNVRNLQREVNILTPTGALTNEILNAAKGHVNGGEFEFILKPTTGLTLSTSASFTLPKYDSWTDVYLVNGVATYVNIADSKFAYIPKTQISASINYDLPINEEYGTLSLLAHYYYQSSVETQEINTSNCGPDGQYKPCLNAGGALPSYGLLNFRVDWRNVGGKGFDLAMFVDNAADKFYRTDAINALGVLGFSASTIAPPRMFGVELRVPFGAMGYR